MVGKSEITTWVNIAEMADLSNLCLSVRRLASLGFGVWVSGYRMYCLNVKSERSTGAPVPQDGE
jgi:hypothetical protein